MQSIRVSRPNEIPRDVPIYPPRGSHPIFLAHRKDVRQLVRNGDAYWENHCKTARLTSWVLDFRGASLRINRAMMDRFVQEIPTAVAAVNGWAGFVEGTRGVPQVRTVEA